MAVVLISGGTGLIGNHLSRYLVEIGYDVIILSRKKISHSSNPKINYSYWDVDKKIIDAEVVKGADHIIHLAGANVMEKKWTTEYKKKILESRTKSAGLIISCLKAGEHNVKTFVSASAIGWYGKDVASSGRREGFIETDLPAKGFLGETTLLWEASVDPITGLGIRLIKLRTGIVLSKEGGAFKEFKTPLRFGIAALMGSGKQIISWIHIDDLCRMYCEAIENNFLNGGYNAVASEPVSQKKLVLLMAENVRHKFFTPVYVPSLLLRLILGKRSMEILKSTTVSNKKIKAAGFTFLYPTIESAINELTGRN
ncbi:MAG: TIGR01777 family oxidoreductase [Ginsengibacter sp.]